MTTAWVARCFWDPRGDRAVVRANTAEGVFAEHGGSKAPFPETPVATGRARTRRQSQRGKDLKIVPAWYVLATGKVAYLDENLYVGLCGREASNFGRFASLRQRTVDAPTLERCAPLAPAASSVTPALASASPSPQTELLGRRRGVRRFP